MAKRHHDGKGMHGHYAGADDRRRQEMQDGRMLNESHDSVANMPQDVKYHKWPSDERDYLCNDGVLDDTIRGIDMQLGMDHMKARKHMMPKKV